MTTAFLSSPANEKLTNLDTLELRSAHAREVDIRPLNTMTNSLDQDNNSMENDSGDLPCVTQSAEGPGNNVVNLNDGVHVEKSSIGPETLSNGYLIKNGDELEHDSKLLSDHTNDRLSNGRVSQKIETQLRSSQKRTCDSLDSENCQSDIPAKIAKTVKPAVTVCVQNGSNSGIYDSSSELDRDSLNNDESSNKSASALPGNNQNKSSGAARDKHEQLNSGDTISTAAKLGEKHSSNPLYIDGNLKTSFKGILKAAIRKVSSDPDLESTDAEEVPSEVTKDNKLSSDTEDALLDANSIECDFSEIEEDDSILDDPEKSVKASINEFKQVKNSITNILDSSIFDDSQSSAVDEMCEETSAVLGTETETEHTLASKLSNESYIGADKDQFSMPNSPDNPHVINISDSDKDLSTVENEDPVEKAHIANEVPSSPVDHESETLNTDIITPLPETDNKETYLSNDNCTTSLEDDKISHKMTNAESPTPPIESENSQTHEVQDDLLKPEAPDGIDQESPAIILSDSEVPTSEPKADLEGANPVSEKHNNSETIVAENNDNELKEIDGSTHEEKTLVSGTNGDVCIIPDGTGTNAETDALKCAQPEQSEVATEINNIQDVTAGDRVESPKSLPSSEASEENVDSVDKFKEKCDKFETPSSSDTTQKAENIDCKNDLKIKDDSDGVKTESEAVKKEETSISDYKEAKDIKLEAEESNSKKPVNSETSSADETCDDSQSSDISSGETTENLSKSADATSTLAEGESDTLPKSTEAESENMPEVPEVGTEMPKSAEDVSESVAKSSESIAEPLMPKTSRLDGVLGSLMSRLGKSSLDEVPTGSDVSMDEDEEEVGEDVPQVAFSLKNVKDIVKEALDTKLQRSRGQVQRKLDTLRKDLHSLTLVSSIISDELKGLQAKQLVLQQQAAAAAAKENKENKEPVAKPASKPPVSSSDEVAETEPMVSHTQALDLLDGDDPIPPSQSVKPGCQHKRRTGKDGEEDSHSFCIKCSANMGIERCRRDHPCAYCSSFTPSLWRSYNEGWHKRELEMEKQAANAQRLLEVKPRPSAIASASQAAPPTLSPQTVIGEVHPLARQSSAPSSVSSRTSPPPSSPTVPSQRTTPSPRSRSKPRNTVSPSRRVRNNNAQSPAVPASRATVRQMLNEKRAGEAAAQPAAAAQLPTSAAAVVDLTEDDEKPAGSSIDNVVTTAAPALVTTAVAPTTAGNLSNVRPGTYVLQAVPGGGTLLVPTPNGAPASGPVVTVPPASGTRVLTTGSNSAPATASPAASATKRPHPDSTSTSPVKQAKTTARKRTAPRKSPPARETTVIDAGETVPVSTCKTTARKRTAPSRKTASAAATANSTMSVAEDERSSSPDIIITTVTTPAPAKQHPAPLPAQPTSQGSAPHMQKLPPRPELKICRLNQGIVLSWNMTLAPDLEEISSYQLFAYQEGSAPPSPSLWKKVGDVKALALPMACTLTQFQEGNKYHFAVRAVDKHKRVGVFSCPKTIHLTKS